MTELRVRRHGATSLEPVNEGNPLPVQEVGVAGHEFSDYESVTVSTTAIGLTPSQYQGSTHAFITVEAASLRYHVSAEDIPTSSEGHQLDAGDTLTLDSAHEIAYFKAIRKNGTDATLRVSYGQ